MPPRQIDVLIATWNGMQTWPLMLQALSELAPTRRRVRFLIVDNASTDGTPELLRRWDDRLPITLLSCPDPGKLPALRVGAAHLQGDLTVMTDDDVLPAPRWLAAYEDAADAHPDLAVFGGPISPFPMEELDAWYAAADGFRHVLFAESDEPDGPVDAAARIYGPNFLMRTAIARELLLRPTALGPTRSDNFPMGEDTAIIKAAAQAGAWYVRAAGVRHLVRRRYTTLAYMLQRAQRHGRGAVLREARGRWDWRTRLARSLDSGARALKLRLETANLDRATPNAETFRRLYLLHWNLGALKGALWGPY